MIRRQYSVSCSKQRTHRPLPQFMVPTARLELAQLAPLPPQDSVSTNFTTSAFIDSPSNNHQENPCVTSVFLLPWMPHQQHLPALQHQLAPAAKQTEIVPLLASHYQTFLACSNQYKP